jgi:hypothetical protein
MIKQGTHKVGAVGHRGGELLVDGGEGLAVSAPGGVDLQQHILNMSVGPGM